MSLTNSNYVEYQSPMNGPNSSHKSTFNPRTVTILYANKSEYQDQIDFFFLFISSQFNQIAVPLS